jgi:HSP20 family protein
MTTLAKHREGILMSESSPWQRGRNFIDEARREVEDVLRRAFAPYSEGGTAKAPTWSPRIDLTENELGFVVKVDLPGVEAKDVDLTIHDGVLIIRGCRNESREEKGTNYHKMERPIGEFQREVPLPGAADEDRVTATASAGVVTIVIPKKPGTVPRRITLQSTACPPGVTPPL